MKRKWKNLSGAEVVKSGMYDLRVSSENVDKKSERYLTPNPWVSTINKNCKYI